jgi:hypothetical protein
MQKIVKQKFQMHRFLPGDFQQRKNFFSPWLHVSRQLFPLFALHIKKKIWPTRPDLLCRA